MRPGLRLNRTGGLVNVNIDMPIARFESIAFRPESGELSFQPLFQWLERASFGHPSEDSSGGANVRPPDCSSESPGKEWICIEHDVYVIEHSMTRTCADYAAAAAVRLDERLASEEKDPARR